MLPRYVVLIALLVAITCFAQCVSAAAGLSAGQDHGNDQQRQDDEAYQELLERIAMRKAAATSRPELAAAPTTAPISVSQLSLDEQLVVAQRERLETRKALDTARDVVVSRLNQSAEYHQAKQHADDATAEVESLRKSRSDGLALASQRWISLRAAVNKIVDVAMDQDAVAHAVQREYV